MYRMTIVPRREYITLLIGDFAIFSLSLWVTLALRILAVPTPSYFIVHFMPFLVLFCVWLFVFFLSGLYARRATLLRTSIPETIFYAQMVNIALAALFFFFVPQFGIAPKTVLAIYLVVSSIFIYGWRVYLFPFLRMGRRLEAVLIGSGPDAAEFMEEVSGDHRYPFTFVEYIDTKIAGLPAVVQRLCRIGEEEKGISVIVADTTDNTMVSVLPIVYEVAFRKTQLSFIDLSGLYQEIFERVPLTLIRYDWVLAHLDRSHAYDWFKRALDIFLGIVGSAFTFGIVYPLVALAIKMEDGGQVIILNERVGRYQKPIQLLKFRSMTGNDQGKYQSGKTKLEITRVGRIIRRLHLDEFPQFWNLIKGDVSFVGPRPEFPVLAEQYSARIPYYNARHLIAPGLTGWARIRHSGAPHHGTDIEGTKRKLAYDLYYLKHRSFLLDIYILFQTVRLVLMGRGT